MSGDASPRPRPRWFPRAAAALGLTDGPACAEGGAFLYYRTVVHRKALPLPRELLDGDIDRALVERGLAPVRE